MSFTCYVHLGAKSYEQLELQSGPTGSQSYLISGHRTVVGDYYGISAKRMMGRREKGILSPSHHPSRSP